MGVPGTQQHPETSALIFRLCFTFYSGERGGDGVGHKALWRQKFLDVLCLLKLWKGEKGGCFKSGKMLHPRGCCAGDQEGRGDGDDQAHHSLYFATLLDLHVSDTSSVRGCNAPQDKPGRDTLLAISYAVCHLAGCIYHRESRDCSASQQSCFSP